MRQRDRYDVSLLYLQELQSARVQLSTPVSAPVQAALQSTQRAAHGHERRQRGFQGMIAHFVATRI